MHSLIYQGTMLTSTLTLLLDKMRTLEHLNFTYFSPNTQAVVVVHFTFHVTIMQLCYDCCIASTLGIPACSSFRLSLSEVCYWQILSAFSHLKAFDFTFILEGYF